MARGFRAAFFLAGGAVFSTTAFGPFAALPFFTAPLPPCPAAPPCSSSTLTTPTIGISGLCVPMREPRRNRTGAAGATDTTAGAGADAAPFGVAVPKDGSMTGAIQAAMQSLMDDGTYLDILTRWGVQDNAIDTATIDGAVY